MILSYISINILEGRNIEWEDRVVDNMKPMHSGKKRT